MSEIRPGGTIVRGPVVDGETRCVHYAGPLDVIALKFACCGEWFPCHLCHEQVADHEATPWPRTSRAEPAVLCGVCTARMSIADYLESTGCATCGAEFNPGCRLHHHLYFD